MSRRGRCHCCGLNLGSSASHSTQEVDQRADLHGCCASSDHASNPMRGRAKRSGDSLGIAKPQSYVDLYIVLGFFVYSAHYRLQTYCCTFFSTTINFYTKFSLYILKTKRCYLLCFHTFYFFSY